MRIGIVTDIHNDADRLAAAIARFGELGVDHIVTIGDSVDAFAPPDGAERVVELLESAGVVGVWGNHDFGLCRDTSERTRSRYGDRVIDYLARMQPSLSLGPCLFTHRPPYVYANDASELWSVSERHDFTEMARRSLYTVTSPIVLIGHHHRWWLADESGPLDWSGDRPIVLDSERRYFGVVGPLFKGACAVYDTATRTYTPMQVGPDS